MSVDGLEAGPLNPKLPVGDNSWGDRNTQFLFVIKDAAGIVGSEGSRGNTSKPSDEVEIVLSRPRTTEETARGKSGGDLVKDQVPDVGNVVLGSLEETVLGLFGDFVFVEFEKATVGGELLLVEVLESCSFRGSRDTLEGLLT